MPHGGERVRKEDPLTRTDAPALVPVLVILKPIIAQRRCSSLETSFIPGHHEPLLVSMPGAGGLH